MKRFGKVICFVLALVLTVGSLPLAHASSADSECGIVYLTDGSYYVISIEETQGRALNTKSAKKEYAYHHANGELMWTVMLKGQFPYDGTSSECTSASVVVLIENDEWYTISKTATKSGNTATGKVTMGRKVLGVKVDERAVTLSLTCDKNGNLS